MAKQKTPSTKRKRGRPRIELDLDMVARLAGIQCTETEIAAALGVSAETIRTRKRDDPDFLGALEKGRETGKASLRRLQWRTAQNEKNAKSATMQIWLGKQWLGQNDRMGIDVATYAAHVEGMAAAVARAVERQDEIAPEVGQQLLDEVGRLWGEIGK